MAGFSPLYNPKSMSSGFRSVSPLFVVYRNCRPGTSLAVKSVRPKIPLGGAGCSLVRAICSNRLSCQVFIKTSTHTLQPGFLSSYCLVLTREAQGSRFYPGMRVSPL